MANPPDIKAIKESLGLSQADLAQILGISRVSLSRLETGKIPLKGAVRPKLEVIHYLLDSASSRRLEELRAVLSDPQARIGLMGFMPCLVNFLPKSNLGDFLRIINFNDWLVTALNSTIDALHVIRDIVQKDGRDKGQAEFLY
jgi:transcriptional regulator with XRE-family HTH domain